MRINEFYCKNFRNLCETEISAFDEMNVICGENAQGKTNLLEGMWLFTGIKSFRSAKDSALVGFGKEKAEIKLGFTAETVEKDAGLEIKEHRTAFLNGSRLKSASMLAGSFKAIVFSPGDLELVSGGPAVRRRFLDIAIGQLYPSYIGISRAYARAVTQRNKIIKDFKYDGTLSVMLDVFEAEIADKGRKICALRRKYTEYLKEYLPTVYGGISSGRETLEAEYRPVCENDFEEALKKARREDMYTGSTSVGPHRDELLFNINGIAARSFGSQGQKRSISLSLKLAEAEIINRVSGEYPVFLLDDVMSELDPERQSFVLNRINGIQAFITCCDPSNIERLKKGKIIKVKNGQVS